MDKYNEWLNSDFIDEKDREVLKNMTKDEIKESFSYDLEFGTAGIRGVMGLGSNKINKYTIGKVTVGLASYLNKKYDKASVVVAYDTRKNSKEYALMTCLILNYYNIKTFLFDEYTSTPELAFSVKYLNCNSGIVITSSHNSKIYNGYKVYNALGSQIVPPEDELIIKEINNISDFNLIKMAPKNNELFNIVPETEKQAFLNENKKAIINENLIKEEAKNIRITYSSLHGVGLKPMKKLFDYYKLNYNIVNEQSTYDSEFKYALNPNPEYIENYELAIKYAKDNDSDVILLSDPDADRIGLMIKNNNDYKLLNGNEIGILFTYYILNNKKIENNNYIVRSLPTSLMVDALCNKYNVKLKEVLTGCKNIAFEKENDQKNYLFGFEESLGYVFNIDVNDKNAFSSSLVIIEILSYCKKNNINIIDYFNNIYKEVGYYFNDSSSIVYNTIDGKEKINLIMNNLRSNKLNIKNIKEKIDYLEKDNNLKTNALKYIFNNDSYLIVRPSGTEPKIKFYFGSSNIKKDIALQNLDELKHNFLDTISNIK